jgi:hypothetical protein
MGMHLLLQILLSLNILNFLVKRMTLLNLHRIAPGNIILLEHVAFASNLCFQPSSHLLNTFPASSSQRRESYMSHQILNLAAFYDHVSARAPQDTYMKGVCVPGDMQIQAMGRGIIGNAPLADFNIGWNE